MKLYNKMFECDVTDGYLQNWGNVMKLDIKTQAL